MRERLLPPAAFLLVTLGAVAAGAQEKTTAGVVTERAGATAIEVPVTVIGKDGKPVAGLTAADFELYDDGKKQEITGFEVVDLNAPLRRTAASPAGEPPPASARRHFLILFDLSYSSPRSLLRARDGASGFVDRELKESDSAAVATYSVEAGWKLLVNFTRDRQQLTRAIETLGFTALTARAADPLSFAFLAPESFGGRSGGGAKGEMEAALQESIQDLNRMQQSMNDDRARGRVAELLKSFHSIGQALDSVRGRKHVLYFSEGFESRLVGGNASQVASSNPSAAPEQSTGDAALSGEIWKVDSDARFGSASTRSRLTDALAVFNRTDTVLHTVDISGLRAEGEVAEKKGSGKDALYTMAAQTGGEFIRNANELSGQLQKLQERTGLIYLLVFQPRKLETPGRFHPLRVKVRSPGARLSVRSGYVEPRPYRALSPIERVLATGDLVTGGAPRDEIGMRLLVAAFSTDDNLAQVPVVLEIPGPALLAGADGNQAAVEIYAYATNADGTLVDYLTQSMGLDLAKVRSTLESGGIKFYGTLFLPPGDYTIRTLVRNGATGHSGVRAASLRVPKVPGGEATLLPPVFAGEAGSWVMVKGKPRADAPQRTADYPFAVAGESVIPVVRPVLSNGQESRVAVFTYNVAAGGAPLSVRSEIVGPDGNARPATVSVLKHSDAEKRGGRKLLLSFKPEGLAPGLYALRIALPSGGKSAENVGAFEIR